MELWSLVFLPGFKRSSKYSTISTILPDFTIFCFFYSSFFIFECNIRVAIHSMRPRSTSTSIEPIRPFNMFSVAYSVDLCHPLCRRVVYMWNCIKTPKRSAVCLFRIMRALFSPHSLLWSGCALQVCKHTMAIGLVIAQRFCTHTARA